MQNSFIQIGNVTFEGFEVPTSLRFGGRYRLVVHTLSDGTRVFEQMGPDDADIRFSGILSGADAESRVRELDNLRLSGAVVWLTWGTFRKPVIIRGLVTTYYNPWWIRFDMTCAVGTAPNIAQSANEGRSPSMVSNLTAAMTAAAGSSITLEAVQQALQGPNVTVIGSSDQSAALAAINRSLISIGTVVSDTSSALALSVPATSDTALAVQDFSTKVANAGTLAAAIIVQAYVARIGATLGSEA